MQINFDVLPLQCENKTTKKYKNMKVSILTKSETATKFYVQKNGKLLKVYKSLKSAINYYLGIAYNESEDIIRVFDNEGNQYTVSYCDKITLVELIEF